MSFSKVGSSLKTLGLLALILIVAYGCGAVATSEIVVPYPNLHSIPEPKGRVVYLRSVEDFRPGLISREYVANQVGIKKLGGMMANRPGAPILLKNHNSAASLMKSIVEHALAKNGYRVSGSPGQDAVVMDVGILTLWVSCDVGMFVKVYGRINVSFEVASRDSRDKFKIFAEDEKTCVSYASEDDFSEAFNNALKKFEDQAASSFRELESL
jgi:hypothetical protein